MKAGKAYHIAESKARKYPNFSRIKMHHSDHPFGGSGKRRVGRPHSRPHSALPFNSVVIFNPKP